MTLKPFVVATFSVMLSIAGMAHAQESGPYKVQKIQLVDGDGGFDYVTADSDGRNLFVARSGPAGHIGVFNLDTLAPVGDISRRQFARWSGGHRDRPWVRDFKPGDHV